MNSDEAIKISLAFDTTVASIECLLDALRALNLDELSEDRQGDIWWMKEYLKAAEKDIKSIDDEIKKIEKLFDAGDEEEKISKVCAVQRMLNMEGTTPMVQKGRPRKTTADKLVPSKPDMVSFDWVKKNAGYHTWKK